MDLLRSKRINMKDFFSLGLPESLLKSLTGLGFHSPTPIQEQVIPLALEGQDILGSAQTGSGKTAAFGIPLVTQLLTNVDMMGLVLVPTRELGLQVIKTLASLIGKQRAEIKTALLIGGESIGKQMQQLRVRPRLIVGTPGRVNDHLLRGSLKLSKVKFLVLDEADRMLDMGFTPQIEKIIQYIPEERQTLLFSATMPKNMVKLAKKYLRQPKEVLLSDNAIPVDNLKQEIVYTSEAEKFQHLMDQLSKRSGSVIVFMKTKISADKMTRRLRQENHSADAIHGDLSHNRRERAIGNFRNQKYRILVATDIAARGLDIHHVKHVINYDLPQCPEDYFHRIGRTARAGAEGEALCFVTPSDRMRWKAIHKIMNPQEFALKEDNKIAGGMGKKRKKNFRGLKQSTQKKGRAYFKKKPATRKNRTNASHAS